MPHRWLVLVIVLLAPMLADGCLGQVRDEAQIQALVRSSVQAINRGDTAALYRMADLDFRAVCPHARYAATVAVRWDGVRPLRLVAIEEISIQHIRATATLVLAGRDGVVRERRAFIRDAGRWYIYEDAALCDVTNAMLWRPRGATSL